LENSILKTYNRYQLSFLRGKGSWLLGNDNSWYLDFGSGIAVNILGHSHPSLIKALNKQSKLLWHTSNLFKIDNQEKLADFLVEKTFADKVFFTNSGAESIECAIKIARKYGNTYKKKKNKIISFSGAFHGRTYGALSISGSKKISEGFEPILDGVENIPFNKLDKLEENITDEVCAVIIEPIQGEGGINEVSLAFIKKLQIICKNKNVLLIFDEIQSGIGRTGKFLAHEFYDAKPDIVTIAKGIGGGFPIGCCLLTNKVAKVMEVGSHGSTFGGNPLGCSVSIAILNEIFKEGFLTSISRKALNFKIRLEELVREYPKVFDEVRGKGFMLGLKCKISNKLFVDEALFNKLILIPGGDNTIRILPPINITKKDLTIGLKIIENVASKLEKKQ